MAVPEAARPGGADRPQPARNRANAADAPVLAVTFDVGNTLLPFRAREMDALLERFLRFVRERVGPCDEAALVARYHEVRLEQYRANLPFLRENDLLERLRLTLETAMRGRMNRLGGCADDATGLAGVEARPDGGLVTPAFLADAVEAYVDALVEALPLPQGVPALLADLRRRYRLGVITNYPYAPGSRRVLRAKGLAEFFDSVVISADWEFIKPHPLLFRQAARELGVRPESLVHVGDDWQADIVGATAAGARSVYFTGLRDEPDPKRDDPAGRPMAMTDDLGELGAILDSADRGVD